MRKISFSFRFVAMVSVLRRHGRRAALEYHRVNHGSRYRRGKRTYEQLGRYGRGLESGSTARARVWQHHGSKI